MRVLVIGGAGYIGSHVVKELIKNNHQVTVFDNLSTGLRQNLFPQNEFIFGDILNINDIENAFSKGFDAFIHLAAFKAVGESMIYPEKYSTNNLIGSINILNAAMKYNCKKMIFSSSCAVFGPAKYLPLDEKHLKEPNNYYGYTKLKIEEIMKWYDTLKNLKYVSLRYFNAAGYDPAGELKGLEQNPTQLIPRIMEVAIGKRKEVKIFGTDYDTRDGTCIRDYIHVTDLATAHVKALEYLDKGNDSLEINLGTNKGTTVLEILNAVKKITNKKIPSVIEPRRPGDPDCLYSTFDYAKKVLDWKPKYSDIDTIIQTTWEAYIS